MPALPFPNHGGHHPIKASGLSLDDWAAVAGVGGGGQSGQVATQNVLRTACFGEPCAVLTCLLPACLHLSPVKHTGVIFKRTLPDLGQSFI